MHFACHDGGKKRLPVLILHSIGVATQAAPRQTGGLVRIFKPLDPSDSKQKPFIQHTAERRAIRQVCAHPVGWPAGYQQALVERDRRHVVLLRCTGLGPCSFTDQGLGSMFSV